MAASDVLEAGAIIAERSVPNWEEEERRVREATEEHVLIQFAKQKSCAAKLVAFNQGAGVYFWDLRGKTYLDFAAQLFNLQLGHQHPTVVAAVTEQAAQACYIRPTSFVFSIRAELAKKLSDLAPLRRFADVLSADAPNKHKVLFTSAGSDAVEYAVKIAKMVTGREKVCTFYRSYHGSTFGCKSFGGDNKNWAGGMSLPGVYKVHNAYPYRCPFGQAPDGCSVDVYVQHVIDTIEYEGAHLTACLLMETVSGSAGCVLIPPAGYLQRLSAYCQEKGILFIADEVMTGFGRTGKMFAVEHWEGVRPDIITVAKGITNGAVPLGACLIAETAAAHFDSNVLFAGLTYSGHPLAMVAGLATLKAFQEEDLIARCAATGAHLAHLLNDLQAKHSHVIGQVRSIGLLAAIELVTDRATRKPVEDQAIIASIEDYLDQRGLYLFIRWGCFFITPPLIISPAQLESGVKIIDDCISKHFPAPQ